MKPEHEEQIISEALESYPLAALPDGFVTNTMARITPHPFWQNLLARLNQAAFLPAALWSFVIGFALLLAGLGWWVYSQINPFHLQLVLNRWLYLRMWVEANLLHREIPSPVVLVAVPIGILLLMMFTWVWTDPRRRHPHYS